MSQRNLIFFCIKLCGNLIIIRKTFKSYLCNNITQKFILENRIDTYKYKGISHFNRSSPTTFFIFNFTEKKC